MFFDFSQPRHVYPISPQLPSLVIRTDGTDAMCGCPCDAETQTIQFQKQYFVPPECGGRITMEELDSFIQQANQILKMSHIPVFPIICMHFCIPFSPYCIMAYYSRKRKVDLKELCERWNTQVLIARGCNM